MGVFEFLTVGALFVALPAVILDGIRKIKATQAKAGDTLRAGELRRMIADAVAEATEPLERRIETLEAIVTDDAPASRLDRRLDPAVLRGVFDEGEASREAPREVSGPARIRA